MIHKILLSIFAIFMFNSGLVWSQAPSGGAGDSGAATGQVPSPADFPQYIVTPREDLDNYDYSNMNKSNFSGNRENLSNFDKPVIQKNNIEINAELQKMEEERKKSSASQENEELEVEDTGSSNQGEGVDVPEDGGYIQPTDNISLYRWVDRDGILHVTDDFGSIPQEYQDQAYKSK